MDRRLLEYNPETAPLAGAETTPFAVSSATRVLSETAEAEWAADLLAVASESGLDRYLGDLIRNAGRAAGQLVSSRTGQALANLLKSAARRALPIVGRAPGGQEAPPAGSRIGGQVDRTGGTVFGLELEGLSPEDQDFEIAKSFVRFADEAVKHAAAAPPGVAPQAAALGGVATAARCHAPGLMRDSHGIGLAISKAGDAGHTGRWVRRGRQILVVNC